MKTLSSFYSMYTRSYFQFVIRERKVRAETAMRRMVTIKSQLHKVFTLEINKLALSANDDKRFILANKIDSRAHGSVFNKVGDTINISSEEEEDDEVLQRA